MRRQKAEYGLRREASYRAMCEVFAFELGCTLVEEGGEIFVVQPGGADERLPIDTASRHPWFDAWEVLKDLVSPEVHERRGVAASAKASTKEDAGARAGTIHRGDIYWIAADDSRGPAPSYAHPHVVVQDDVFNHSRITTVVVCALTTNLRRSTEPGNLLLEVGEGNLPAQSVVVVSQISSVDKDRLGERIGSLSDARVEQILAGLRFQQVSFFER
jgi:mRNA interferase MazF